MATQPNPNLTLYFLQSSRSIRIAWLLEELHLPYSNLFYPRENNKTPSSFASESGNPLGKAPSLKDGALTISESGNITEYLIEKYDPEQSMMGGKDEEARNRIRGFVHAAEGTFLVHALAVTYARWFCPDSVRESGELRVMEEGMAGNVGRDLDWLEGELEGKRFLAGEKVTAADTMCLFSVQFIFARDLCAGRGIGEWPRMERWVGDCEGTETWKRAVEKTGHKL